jgi:hypothetical protein
VAELDENNRRPIPIDATVMKKPGENAKGTYIWRNSTASNQQAPSWQGTD